MSEFDLTAPGPALTALPGLPGLAALGRLGAALARIVGAQGSDLPDGRPDLEHVAVVRAAEPTAARDAVAAPRTRGVPDPGPWSGIRDIAGVHPGHPGGDRGVSTGTGTGDGIGDGTAVADRLVDGGTRLIAVEGGDTASAFTVIAALLDLEPISAVGTTPSAGWAAQLVAVRDGLARSRAHVGDPRRLLVVAGEPGLLTGVLIQAAVRRTPVLIDGSAEAAAALLVADRLAPGVAAWCTAATTATSPGAAAALAELDLEPLLDLGLRAHGAGLTLALLREGLARA